MSKKQEKHGIRHPSYMKAELDVLSGHLYLLNKIFEEKALEGQTPAQVLNWMIWKEGEELFGMNKTKKIIRSFYSGEAPNIK